MARKDNLYSNPDSQEIPFVFDETVAGVFPDMIQRSVPGYAEVIKATGLIAETYAQPDTRVYDLGCSLGASTLSMASRLGNTPCKIIGIDNSEAMLTRCRKNLSGFTVSLRCEDIRNTELSNASVIVMNYTLQFVPPDQRVELLSRIYQALVPGGVVVLSEKLSFDSLNEQTEQTRLHEAFKLANGYSELEISQKRAALESVLVPETAEAHLNRLIEIGFKNSQLWYRFTSFASFLAWK